MRTLGLILAILLPGVALAQIGLSASECDKVFRNPINELRHPTGTSFQRKYRVGEAILTIRYISSTRLSFDKYEAGYMSLKHFTGKPLPSTVIDNFLALNTADPILYAKLGSRSFYWRLIPSSLLGDTRSWQRCYDYYVTLPNGHVEKRTGYSQAEAHIADDNSLIVTTPRYDTSLDPFYDEWESRPEMKASQLGGKDVLGNTNAVSIMTNERDDFQKVTWHFSRRSPLTKLSDNTTAEVQLYAGEHDSGIITLRLRSEYTDYRTRDHNPDWIFYEQVQLLSDSGAALVIPCEYPEKQNDNGTYGISEWSDNNVEPGQVLPFKSAKSIRVRFEGKYSPTFTLSRDALDGIQDVIFQYEQLIANN